MNLITTRRMLVKIKAVRETWIERPRRRWKVSELAGGKGSRLLVCRALALCLVKPFLEKQTGRGKEVSSRILENLGRLGIDFSNVLHGHLKGIAHQQSSSISSHPQPFPE